MHIKSCLTAGLLAQGLAFGIANPAQAAEWVGVSLHVGISGPGQSEREFQFAASPFRDGTYLPYNDTQQPATRSTTTTPDTYVLSDSPNLAAAPTFEGEQRGVITFRETIGPAPGVNTVGQTVQLGSIFLNEQTAVYDCEFSPSWCAPGQTPSLVWADSAGWDFAPEDAMPYVANQDGTFSVSWIGTTPDNFFAGWRDRPITFTFAAAPVPEPASWLTVLAGVALVAARWKHVARKAGAA